MSLADPRTVGDLLNYRLTRLLAASGAMVVRLCEGRYGITRREWRVIAVLAEQGPLSPSQLAQSTHWARARVSALITQLSAKKLLRRLSVQQDARRAQVVLTADGKAVYDALLPQAAAFHREVISALPAEDVASFERALETLTATAERIAAARPVADKADRRHGGARKVRPSR